MHVIIPARATSVLLYIFVIQYVNGNLSEDEQAGDSITTEDNNTVDGVVTNEAPLLETTPPEIVENMESNFGEINNITQDASSTNNTTGELSSENNSTSTGTRSFYNAEEGLLPRTVSLGSPITKPRCQRMCDHISCPCVPVPYLPLRPFPPNLSYPPIPGPLPNPKAWQVLLPERLPKAPTIPRDRVWSPYPRVWPPQPPKMFTFPTNKIWPPYPSQGPYPLPALYNS